MVQTSNAPSMINLTSYLPSTFKLPQRIPAGECVPSLAQNALVSRSCSFPSWHSHKVHFLVRTGQSSSLAQCLNSSLLSANNHHPLHAFETSLYELGPISCIIVAFLQNLHNLQVVIHQFENNQHNALPELGCPRLSRGGLQDPYTRVQDQLPGHPRSRYYLSI